MKRKKKPSSKKRTKKQRTCVSCFDLAIRFTVKVGGTYWMCRDCMDLLKVNPTKLQDAIDEASNIRRSQR